MRGVVIAEQWLMLYTDAQSLVHLMLAALVGNPSELHVLLAGTSGEMASQLSKRLHAKGVPSDNMLFCDFF